MYNEYLDKEGVKKKIVMSHKEQIRVKCILFHELLNKLGWTDYTAFVDRIVPDCANAGMDASGVFRMLGQQKKREGNKADISIERCVEIEKGFCRTLEENDKGNTGWK